MRPPLKKSPAARSANVPVHRLVALAHKRSHLIAERNAELRDKADGLSFALARSEEITGALEEKNKELAALSATDGLTGILNHRAFQEACGRHIKTAARYGEIHALLLLDVDHFKQYNDSFGHPAGDEALRAVANALRRISRPDDDVARYGGEEFAVLVRVKDLAALNALSQRFLGAIREISGLERPLTASMGVGICNAGSTVETMIAEADSNLYCSKEDGRDRVTLPKGIISDAPTMPPAP